MRSWIAVLIMMLFVALPAAAAENADVAVSGDLIGAYGIDTGAWSDRFLLFSSLDYEYSNMALKASVSDTVAATYRAGFDDYLFDGSIYTREAYISLMNVAPVIDEIKVGQFHFPYGAGQWFGFLRGQNSFIGNMAPGVEISGSLDPVDYRLAVTNPMDMTNNVWSISQSGDKPIWARVSTPLGALSAGLSYVKGGETNALGVDLSFDAGSAGIRAEYIAANNLWGYDRRLLFAGVDVPLTGPLTIFGEFYNSTGGTSPGSAYGAGLDYALGDNAALRIKYMSDDDRTWAPSDRSTEAQLRVTF